MFEKEKSRYVTRGVNEEIPLELQVFLWNIISKRVENNEKLDYLQIFQLNKNENKQIVTNVQEEPELQREFEYIPIFHDPICKKVWVIDDGKNCTMLLPSEY